jgi:hypothetical protein
MTDYLAGFYRLALTFSSWDDCGACEAGYLALMNTKKRKPLASFLKLLCIADARCSLADC